jgi:hypothetical protein
MVITLTNNRLAGFVPTAYIYGGAGRQLEVLFPKNKLNRKKKREGISLGRGALRFEGISLGRGALRFGCHVWSVGLVQ